MRLLDTSALLEGERDGKILLCVVSELDNLKTKEGLIGKKARDTIKIIYRDLMENIYNEEEFYDVTGMRTDDILLLLAGAENWTLVTADLSLFLKANALNLEREFIEGGKNQYKLRPTSTYLTDREYCEILEGNYKAKHAENHFLIFGEEAFRIIDGKPEHIMYQEIRNSFNHAIKPRNVEQKCLIHLLHSDVPVVAVHSKYGCGKSFLMLNYILATLGDGKRFKKLLIIPNNSAVLESRDVGTLPGDILEKEFVYLGPMIDMFGKDIVRQMLTDELIEVAPVAFVRGRSWDDSIIWVSEAQNLTSYHAKLLLGRVGENSKMLFDGDVRQEDNKIFTNNSGLVTLHRLSETPSANLFGSVELKTIERSKVARMADELDQLEG